MLFQSINWWFTCHFAKKKHFDFLVLFFHLSENFFVRWVGFFRFEFCLFWLFIQFWNSCNMQIPVTIPFFVKFLMSLSENKMHDANDTAHTKNTYLFIYLNENFECFPVIRLTVNCVDICVQVQLNRSIRQNRVYTTENLCTTFWLLYHDECAQNLKKTPTK